MSDTPTLSPELLAQLAAPFDAADLTHLCRDFDPYDSGGTSGTAVPLAYIQRGPLIARLNQVVPGQWSFHWELVHLRPCSDAAEALVAVQGTLTICGVSRSDAGEANGGGELLKAAVTDCLKRCSTQFGIAAYLYFLPRDRVPAAKRLSTGAVEPRQPIVYSPETITRAVARALGDDHADASAAEAAAPALPDGESDAAALGPETNVKTMQLAIANLCKRRFGFSPYRDADRFRAILADWDPAARTGKMSVVQYQGFYAWLSVRQIPKAADAIASSNSLNRRDAEPAKPRSTPNGARRKVAAAR
jgi:hypothetical protein